MKIKCGTDIVDVARFSFENKSIEEAFIKRVFTECEIEYCESKKGSKYQHYAARFAAKEAVFKAISEELNDKFEISWKNIQVKNDENGRPLIDFIDRKFDNIKSIDLSLSHLKDYAVATCVVIIDK